MKHKPTHTFSKGNIKVQCSCGWQSPKVPDNHAGHAIIRTLWPKHPKGANVSS